MIDIKIGDREDVARCGVSGTVLDLTAESLVMLKIVYDAIKEHSEGGAILFKEAIKDNVETAFDEEPAWKRDDKKKPSLDDQFGDIIGELNALCNRVDEITGGRK